MRKNFEVETLLVDVRRKKGAVSQNQRQTMKTKKKVGFNDLIDDDNSIYSFWLEIKDMFESDGGATKILRRKKLIYDFLIDYGHWVNCYQFINRLVDMELFENLEDVENKRKDLILGRKFRDIIIKMEKKSAEKIGIFESVVEEKMAMDQFLEEQKELFKKFQEEIGLLKQQTRKIKKSITMERIKTERDLAVLRKSLR